MASTFDQARKILKDLQSKATSYVAKDFQRQPVVQGFNNLPQPVKTFGNAAFNQVKNVGIQGTQSAYRQLQSGNNASMGIPMNFMLKKTQPQPTLRQTGQDILNQGNLVATGLGLPKLLTAAGGVALGTSGLLGGTFNKFTNGSFWEGAGTGVGMTPSMLGITRFTNPLIEQGVSRFAPQINNTIGKFVAPRITRGVLNIPEGALIDSSLGRRPLSPESMVMDLVSGSVLPGSPNTRGINTDELIKKGKALGIKGVNPEAFILHPQDRDQLAEIGSYILNKKPLELPQKQSLTRLYERYLPGVNLDTVKISTIQKQIAWLMDINNEIPKGQRTKFPGMGLVNKNVANPPLSDIEKLNVQAGALKDSIFNSQVIPEATKQRLARLDGKALIDEVGRIQKEGGQGMPQSAIFDIKDATAAVERIVSGKATPLDVRYAHLNPRSSSPSLPQSGVKPLVGEARGVTPEEIARQKFQKSWSDTYGNRPATINVKKETIQASSDKTASLDQMLNEAKKVNKTGKYYSTESGIIRDNATNKVVFDPSGKTTDEAIAFYKTLTSQEQKLSKTPTSAQLSQPVNLASSLTSKRIIPNQSLQGAPQPLVGEARKIEDPYDFIKKEIPEIKDINNGILTTKDGNKIELRVNQGGEDLGIHWIQAEKTGSGVGTKIINSLKKYVSSRDINEPHALGLKVKKSVNDDFWKKQGFIDNEDGTLSWSPSSIDRRSSRASSTPLPVNQSLQGATVKGTTEVSQTPQTRPQPQPSQVKPSEVVPEVPVRAVEGTGGSSSNPIISQQDKYAFNINKPRLGLSGESAKKLDEVVETMRPVLEQRKGKPLTDDEIITAGRKAQLLDTVMGRDESKKFAEALQASRNFLKSESSKQGLSPEFLAQLEIVSSHASDKGRSLRAFAVDAEDAGIKQQVTRDLQKLGIDTKRLIEASKNVDWDNAQQVTEFYRKFKPAAFLEKLEEYRYANMLSSPNTQINNIFSNFLQSGIVTPVEKTLTGTLDFARSRLTGKEQKYFVGQGVDYANGYWSSLPQAWKSFRSVLSGDGGLAKPDIDFIPTGTGKLHKIYTTPLRALEATDQFFRTLVIGGESKSLQRAGVTGAEAVKKAEAEATYRVFRQKFDPDGKLGQGGVLKVWDKWNVGINHLRQLPGGKWIVPFLQTPTNILKQGVEYSPLGLATIPGSKEPMVQLSKAMIGSSVFVGAYSLADAGLTTWDTPINKKDKDAFYEAGLQPYSVKIGDKWVSYSKLGPLSYPIAMAAAMKWAKDNGADNNALEVAGAGVGGFLQFFADQSYMQGIGDVIDAVRGDKWKQGRSIANIPSQLIPYRALQGWAARLIDPVYRDISGDSIPEQAIDSIKSQVPFLSKTLDPLVDSNGEESKRSNPFLNAVSPFKMSQQTDTYMPRSAKAIYGEFNKLKTPEEKSALWEQMVKDKRITKENVSDIKRQFIDAELGITEKEVSIRNSGVADGTRAREVYKEFNKLKTPEEKVALWEKYVKAKIITKDVAKQLKYLLQQ